MSTGLGDVTSANGVTSPFLILCQYPLPELILFVVLLPSRSAYPIAFLNCEPNELKFVVFQFMNPAFGPFVKYATANLQAFFGSFANSGLLYITYINRINNKYMEHENYLFFKFLHDLL